MKEAAKISMGTELSAEDLSNISEVKRRLEQVEQGVLNCFLLQLCGQVIAIGGYRKQLGEYLRNRMNAIAPNLTVMVGELVRKREGKKNIF